MQQPFSHAFPNLFSVTVSFESLFAYVIRRVQDILDRQSPPANDDEVEVVEEEEDDSEEEGDLPICDNTNYSIAKAELDSFEEYKRNKYRPTFDRSKSKCSMVTMRAGRGGRYWLDQWSSGAQTFHLA